jgi:tetratricopeptide (TPR) repeat protein/TolB-like protein
VCFSRPWWLAFGALSVAVIATGASRSHASKPAIPRLAIVRFENLTGDDSLDWMGRAASEVMSAELAGSRTISVIPLSALRGVGRILGARPPAAPGISTETPAALVSGATRILSGRISLTRGKLRLDATIEDTARQKTERTLDVIGPVSGGIIPLADALAHQIDAVRDYETHDAKALQEYSAGLDSTDPAAASRAYSRAVARDPNFGAAYVAWAELAAAQNDHTEAERVLALAAARGSAIAEISRARLDAVAAGLRRDPVAALRALAAEARLNPTDVTLDRQLAQANLNARRYRDAAENLRKALEIEPDNTALLNQLGYAEMFAGDLVEARKPLDEYARLRPTDANAFDSLGDVHFYLGAFNEAEKYYQQAYATDNNFAGGGELLKAAHARLITGDVRGADGIFQRYLAARANAKDPALEFRQAEWEFSSGRRREAIAWLETFARTGTARHSPDTVALADAQLAVWMLELGNRTRARECAARAVSTKSVAALTARLLTESPAGVSEWTARVERDLPGAAEERIRNLVLAYALLFAKDFQAAMPLLKRAYEHSPPDPQETLPVLLAWALIETGHSVEAAPLIAGNPVPKPGGADLFASLSFPRLLFLRAEVLARREPHAEAQRYYRSFLTLSGPDPEIFGEEDRARQALGR